MSRYQEKGCDVCETFPYLDDTGMCAACTFGEAQAQVDMLNGEYSGTIWEREKVNAICGVKLSDRDEAIGALNKLGADFKSHNNGFQLNIKTHGGLVMYWPSTRKVRYQNCTSRLFWMNTDQSEDIIGLVKELGFDKVK